MSKELLIPEIVIDKPDIPENWDYEKSVKKVKGFIYKWKNITEDIAKEICNAREILSSNWEDQERLPDGIFVPPDKTWNQYCQDIGTEKRTVNRWLNKWYPPEKSVHFLSQSSEWTTPQSIIDKTIQVLREIDLDPCSNPDFPNVPAKKHFRKKDDAFSKEWHGKIYMNPPYGNEIKNWINYLCEQYEKGNIQEAIALTPSRTDTQWFRKLKNYPRCFIWGRLKFGDSGNSAPFPSMAIYLGINSKNFINIFSNIGDIYEAVT